MKDYLGRSLTRSISLAFAVKIAGAVTAFVVHLFLARILKPDAYGSFSYGMTIAFMTVLLARLGLDTAALRVVGSAWPEDHGTIAAYHRFAWRTTTVSSLLASTVLIAVGLILRDIWNPEMGTAIAMAAAVVPGCALTALGAAELRGMGDITRSMVPEEILRPLLLLVFVVMGVSVLTIGVPGSVVALAGAGAAYGISAVLVLRWFHRRLPGRGLPQVPAQGRVWLGIGLPLIAVSSFNLLMTRTDIVVIGSMLGPASAGVYAASGKFTIVTISIVMAANTIAAPLIARHHANGDQVALKKLVSGVLRIIVLVTVPVSIGLSLLAPQLLSLLGPEYVPGAAVLSILALGFAFNSTMSLVGILLNMTGAERFSAISLGVVVVVNLLLDLYLVPRHGIEGAAAATVASKVIWNLVSLVYVQRHLGLNWLDILLARNLERSSRPDGSLPRKGK